MTARWLRRLLAAVALGAAAFVLVCHPSRPLYMQHRSVEIRSADGTVLAGTLSLPRWTRRPVAAVVLVHGSGRLGREHLRGDVRRLVRAGYGVLAYDKRGVGASGGEYLQADPQGFEAVLRRLAEDAAAALEHARRSRGIDPERVGFFGASQAGWIIPLAGERLDPPPRFQVILSGAAVSTGVEDSYSRLTGDGISTPLLRDEEEIRRRVAAFDGPAGFDPAPLLRSQRIPTLWLLGGRDESVPTFASLPVLESIRASGNDAHTTIVYPNADHGLRDRDSGRPAPIWDDLLPWLERSVAGTPLPPSLR